MSSDARHVDERFTLPASDPRDHRRRRHRRHRHRSACGAMASSTWCWSRRRVSPRWAPASSSRPTAPGSSTGWAPHRRWPPSPSSRRRTSSATGGPARHCSSCRSGRRCARPSRLPISTRTAPTCWPPCSPHWAIATCSGAGLPRCGKTPAASKRCSRTAQRTWLDFGRGRRHPFAGARSGVRARRAARGDPRSGGRQRRLRRMARPGSRRNGVGSRDRAPLLHLAGPGRSVVLYYVSAGRLLNWIGIGRSDEAKRESWSATGSVDALLADFAGWHPQIVGLMAATERPFITRLHDREPLASWVKGRAVLLGDAAHAMLPYHAQGAVQSLEDAWVLARSIAMATSTVGSASTRSQARSRRRCFAIRRCVAIAPPRCRPTPARRRTGIT